MSLNRYYLTDDEGAINRARFYADRAVRDAMDSIKFAYLTTLSASNYTEVTSQPPTMDTYTMNEAIRMLRGSSQKIMDKPHNRSPYALTKDIDSVIAYYYNR